MDKHQKTISLLEAFLSDKVVDGVCGYMVIPDDDEDSIQVIVILDIDYIQNSNTKPGFVEKMIRNGVKQEIKKWLNLDVYVGSTTKKCDAVNSISESMSAHVKRRLSNIKLLDELTTMLDYEINLSHYNTPSDAVEEICDMLNERILDEIWMTTNLKVSLKEKDELYWYLVNKFNKYITQKYNESQEITESKKPIKYIITENQYRLIRRESEMKKLIDDSLELIDLQNDLTRRGWNVIPLQNLSLIVAEYVSNTIATKSNLDGDDYVIFRNQIKQYIKNNFYDYLKEFWESKQ
jgi:hypothetical protein